MDDTKDTDETTPSKLSMMLRNAAQKVAGDTPAQGDEITPTGSPIDLIAGGAGGMLGKSMAAAAPAMVGNEIGAVGANVAADGAGMLPKLANMAGRRSAAYMPEMTQQAVDAAVPIGEGLANSTKDTIATQMAKQAAKLRALQRMSGR